MVFSAIDIRQFGRFSFGSLDDFHSAVWTTYDLLTFRVRPKTAAAQSHTDFSRVERVDRVESVALLDDKRPYSTLMFSRKERKGRKRKRQLHQCYCVDKL